ncbi:MAG: archaellin/type IV pilin N-terminal domain-containing protein [Candidatus Pacearchaeota archaeon]
MHKNKKALSEVVGYAILIVIALSLSVMVYAFLKIYIPKEKLECNEDIVLILGDVSCSFQSRQLNITLMNRGLFKADAAYIRFGNESQKIKPQINKNNFLLYGPDNTAGLNPGESFFANYSISSEISLPGIYGLEVQPAVIKNKQIVVCEKAIITQTVRCD